MTDPALALSMAILRITSELNDKQRLSTVHMAKMVEADTIHEKAIEGAKSAGYAGFHDGLRRAVVIIREELGLG